MDLKRYIPVTYLDEGLARELREQQTPTGGADGEDDVAASLGRIVADPKTIPAETEALAKKKNITPKEAADMVSGALGQNEEANAKIDPTVYKALSDVK